MSTLSTLRALGLNGPARRSGDVVERPPDSTARNSDVRVVGVELEFWPMVWLFVRVQFAWATATLIVLAFSALVGGFVMCVLWAMAQGTMNGGG